MDLERFVELTLANPSEFPGNLGGLYCIKQAGQLPSYKWVRAGLAGKPVDISLENNVKDRQGSFRTRFLAYLNTWGPTGAKVYAVLTVERKTTLGFASRVLPPRQEGDNRPDHARMDMARTVIAMQEERYHRLLTDKFHATRWKLKTTQEGRQRSEFFSVDPSVCIEALKLIGTGDLFTFKDDTLGGMTRRQLRKRGIDQPTPTDIALRKSERLADKPLIGVEDEEVEEEEGEVPFTLHVSTGKKVVDQLTAHHSPLVGAFNGLGAVRRSSRISERVEPLHYDMTKAQLEALEKGTPTMKKGVRTLLQVRRSPRQVT